MTWHEHNIALLDTVASRLDAAGVEVVFVGGITTSLYLDDAFAGAARGTDDVDCIVEVTTRLEMSKIEKKLRKAGFANDVSPCAPVCRWLCSSIKVDVMPIAREVFGFSNRWYADGHQESAHDSLAIEAVGSDFRNGILLGEQIRCISRPRRIRSLFFSGSRGHCLGS